MLWESSLCRFHTGFLLSLLPFPVPEERLIPLLSHPTILSFVFISPPGPLNAFLFYRGDRGISEFMCKNKWFQSFYVRKPHLEGVDYKMHKYISVVKNYFTNQMARPRRNKCLIWFGQTQLNSNTSPLYLISPLRTSIFPPLPLFLCFVFLVTSSIRSPSPSSPQGLSVNLLSGFPLLLLRFSVCFLRWWGGEASSLAGDAACEESSNRSLGPCWFHYFLLLGDFHRGNPIRIRRGPAGEGALPGGVGCVCVCEFMAWGSRRMID